MKIYLKALLISLLILNCYLPLPSLYHLSPVSVPPTWIVMVMAGGGYDGGRWGRCPTDVMGDLSTWNVHDITWNLGQNSLYDSKGL